MMDRGDNLYIIDLRIRWISCRIQGIAGRRLLPPMN